VIDRKMIIDKKFIRDEIADIIKHNPHKTPITRLEYFADYLADMYTYDDNLQADINHDEHVVSPANFARRERNLIEQGLGNCQDFTNGLSYLANMDGIPCWDLYHVIEFADDAISAGIKTKFGMTKEGHALNFIPRGVFGKPYFIDMTPLRGEEEEEMNREFKKSKWFCVSLERLLKSRDGLLEELCKIDRSKNNVPYFKMTNHWKNMGGEPNFEKLHKSMFKCTYEIPEKGLPKKEV